MRRKAYPEIERVPTLNEVQLSQLIDIFMVWKELV